MNVSAKHHAESECANLRLGGDVPVSPVESTLTEISPVTLLESAANF